MPRSTRLGIEMAILVILIALIVGGFCTLDALDCNSTGEAWFYAILTLVVIGIAANAFIKGM